MSATDKDGWVEHRGKRRPVRQNVFVNLWLREYGPSEVQVAAGYVDWIHSKEGADGTDVIFYRVVKP